MKRQKIKRSFDNYALGTGAGGTKQYLPNPSEVLAKNSINIAKAQSQSESNPWAIGLQSLAGLIGANANSIGSAFQNTEGTDIGRPPIATDSNNPETPILALGTSATGTPGSEVEGGEMFELPTGEIGEFEGPSHEDGGMPVALPEGTTIFSDRIKIGDKTMSERKEAREALLKKVLSKFDKSPVDKILRNTLERTEERNALQEEADLAVQETAGMADKLIQGEVQKFAFGTGPDGIEYDEFGNPIITDDLINKYPRQSPLSKLPYTEQNPYTSTPATASVDKPGTIFSRGLDSIADANSFTTGDVIGMAGTAYSAVAPLLNTRRNRAMDTPNINAFENFGEDALNASSEAIGALSGLREENIGDVRSARNAAISRNRSSARGVNTQRALDLTSDVQANEAIENIYSGFAESLSGLYTQRAGLENQQDSAVMAGEQEKDLNDRKDKDQYYSNLAENKANLGVGIQKIGADLNKNKQNEDFLDILPATTLNGVGMNRDSKGWFFTDANGNKEYITVQKKKAK